MAHPDVAFTSGLYLVWTVFANILHKEYRTADTRFSSILGVCDNRLAALHNKPARDGMLHGAYDGLERAVTSYCARGM